MADDGPRIEVSGRLVRDLLVIRDDKSDGSRRPRRQRRKQAQDLSTAPSPPASSAAPLGLLPLAPPAHSASHPGEHSAALAEIQRLTEEARQLKDSILTENEERLAKVKQMAADLHAKEFRAPTRAPVCLDERQACTSCYRENRENPLKCAEVVKRFVDCARVAEERFIG